MEKIKIADREFSSRLFLGTGKFNNNQQMAEAIKASETEMVTVAMKRVELSDKNDDLLTHVIQNKNIQLLPNTSGVRDAKEAVFAREESMPTGLDNGIAVPHGRTDGVNRMLVVLALVDNSENENGIIPDYETIDHSKIQILGLTLIPDSINTPYLQLIAALIRILQDDENRELLLSCKTPNEMRKLICSMQ